jgi:hypothetical protein
MGAGARNRPKQLIWNAENQGNSDDPGGLAREGPFGPKVRVSLASSRHAAI